MHHHQNNNSERKKDREQATGYFQKDWVKKQRTLVWKQQENEELGILSKKNEGRRDG